MVKVVVGKMEKRWLSGRLWVWAGRDVCIYVIPWEVVAGESRSAGDAVSPRLAPVRYPLFQSVMFNHIPYTEVKIGVLVNPSLQPASKNCQQAICLLASCKSDFKLGHTVQCFKPKSSIWVCCPGFQEPNTLASKCCPFLHRIQLIPIFIAHVLGTSPLSFAHFLPLYWHPGQEVFLLSLMILWYVSF